MKKIVIDPITRIEGHLRAEVQVNEKGIVQEAYVSGQLFRGIELILKNRDPRDAGLLAGRICGVCTNSHFRGSIQAVENAYEIKTPKNANLIRDLMSMALFIQDHVVHFYQLHLLDYVDVTSALQANAKLTSKEAHLYCKRPFRNSHTHYEAVLQRLDNFVKAGKLGPFSNGYWGHKAYRLSSEQNLLLLSHYFEALKFQVKISKAVAIFGGKTPHPQSLVVGGVTSVVDMLNPQRLNDFLFIMKEASDFVNRAYISDMKLLAHCYKEQMKNAEGRANGNFLSAGGYEIDQNKPLFSSGVMYAHDFDNIELFDASKISEEVKQAWYNNENPNQVEYTDLNPDGSLKTEHQEDKYSWVKAPRYGGKTMETGPLARVLIGYAQNNEAMVHFTDEFLRACDLELMDLSSSVGRNCARAIETQIICEYIFTLISNLIQNVKYYDTQTWQAYEIKEVSKTDGIAFLEVPRGMLMHHVQIENQRIQNYQVIAPTTWNASPKNSDGIRAAYEEALVGLKLENVNQPLEVLRVLHSFDPCLACAVHVIDCQGKTMAQYKITKSMV